MTRRIFQRFEVVATLGKGGMGTVYLARDPQLEREVAIKTFLEPAAPTAAFATHHTIDLRAPTSAADDLLAEARVMARLSHPNVLPIFEVGIADGQLFLVMEYVAGCNLRTWLEEPRTRTEIRATFAQAARGLAAAHACGIIHRDFKPDNVLIGDGRVRVADFGLSGLVAPTSMVRLADGRGTPRYMAPELWEGATATVRSDVYAFCRTLADALELDKAPVDPRLSAVIGAGLDDDPAARPELPHVIAALEGSHRRRWPWLAAGAGAIAAGAIAIALLVTSGPSASCDGDPQWLAARWTPAARAELRYALPPGNADAIVAIFDHQASAIASARRSTCEARGRGEVTNSQELVASSCLERRAMELAATAHVIAHVQATPAILAEQGDALPSPAICTQVTAPAIAGSHDEVFALWGRLAESRIANVPCKARLVPLDPLEADAERLGEVEVAVAAEIVKGTCLRVIDQYTTADTVDEHAYQKALAIHSPLAQNALLERGRDAIWRGDPTTGASYATLAADMAGKYAPVQTLAMVQMVLGEAAKHRHELVAAKGYLEQGRELLRRDGSRFPSVKRLLLVELTDTLLGIDGQQKAGAALARETADFVRGLVGDRNEEYAVALTRLADAQESLGDWSGALATRAPALALYRELHPADSTRVLEQRVASDADLVETGESARAHDDYAEVVALADGNPALSRQYALALEGIARTTFALGHSDEALHLYDKAIGECIARFGKAGAPTLYTRWYLAGDLLELGRLDDAEHQMETLLHETGGTAELGAEAVEVRAVLGGGLALARGKPGDAEAAARAALATYKRLALPDVSNIDVLIVLGRSLFAEQRYDAARASLVEARGLAKRSDVVATIDVALARVDAAQGNRDDARARARAAREVLEKFPGQLRARGEADALLAH